MIMPADAPRSSAAALRHLVWAFNVDGCLVDSLTGTSLRPGALEVLGRLRKVGATVLHWSAGGRELVPTAPSDRAAAMRHDE
jgi:hypothetical protein